MTVPLPPLPPVPGESDEHYRPAGRDMLSLLTEEHRRIQRLCAELADPAGEPGRRIELAQVFTATVTRHLSAEEQYLYPTVRAALPSGEQLAEREITADLRVLRALKELAGLNPGEPDFDRVVGEVGAALHRHARATGEEIFPALREVATEADLIRLGNRVEIAEEAAPTRPHPATPAAPPWNKVVEPAIGVVDKVRDVVAGRPTRAEDLAPPQVG